MGGEAIVPGGFVSGRSELGVGDPSVSMLGAFVVAIVRPEMYRTRCIK